MAGGKSACDGAQGDRGFPMAGGKSACDGAQGDRGFPMAGGKSACDGAQGDRGFPMAGGESACNGAQGDRGFPMAGVCLLVGCLTSQQQASVSQGRICSDNFTCCHTEIEVADPTFYLTQSQYTDTGPTSPSADPITPGAWQGSHWSANF